MRVNATTTYLDPAVTQSLQYFGELVGRKPHVANAILVKKPYLTLTMLTEVLGNIYTKKKSAKQLTPIKALEYRHFIKTHQIPVVRFTEDLTDDLAGGVEGVCYMDKKYYSPRDVFKLKNEQQIKVTREPLMVAPNRWKHWIKIWGNSLSERINTQYTTKGQETQYITNYQPEFSERGYDKFVYNIEEHANFISCHRHGYSKSQLWGLTKSLIMQHNGQRFKLDEDDKRVLDLYYLSRERAMVFGKTSIDPITGKCMQFEEDGRQIIAGDGVYEQYKKFCGFQSYTTMSRDILDDAIAAVVDKLPEKTGNTIMVNTGYQGYLNLGRLMEQIIGSKQETGYFYTKSGNKVKVGAEFPSYELQGNTLMFSVNKAFDHEISDFDENGKSLKSQEMVFMDITIREQEQNEDTGAMENIAPIQMITLEGGQMLTGTLKGMGGLSGSETGIDLGTTVAASRHEVMGFSGAVVADPYAGHIIKKVAA